ncbi:MAG TPA: hypothetical protein VIK84_00455 [Haloplasmataceae bacterium]
MSVLGILLLIQLIICEFYVFPTPSNFMKALIKALILPVLILLNLIILNLSFKTVIIIFIFSLLSFFLQVAFYLLKKGINDKILFIIKIFLFFILITVLSNILNSDIKLSYYNYLTQHTYHLQIILSLVLLVNPCNIIFKKYFQHFKPQDDYEANHETPKNAGATIGILERLLIFLCLLNQLYTSIGLIFTAKSIARYKRINDEPAFAEYYLIGTLTSVLMSIMVYIISFIII